jgi:hypothetical protein
VDRRRDAGERARPRLHLSPPWAASDGLAFYALAHWRTREGARAFFQQWEIDTEPGEIAIDLEGDVGLVPLGGDAA